jgi:amino acid adenylation domain-containing protein
MQKTTVEGFRLSPQQKRLWQITKIEQRAPQYLQCTLALKGELDARALREAVTRMISRHEILRTAFHSLPAVGFPLQVITDGAMTMADDNLSGEAEDGWRDGIERLLAQEREPMWECEANPLLRLRLARLSPQEHALLITLPALCADSRTLSLFAGELAAGYGEAAGDRGGEAEEAMQYADVSEWQNELLEGEETAAGRAYWRGQSWNGCARLRLPFEGGRRAAEDAAFNAGRQTVELSEGESKELAAAACEHGVGVVGWLQACWQVLLWRLSGQPEEFALGVINDGRKYEELANALGPLARLLPIRLKMRGGQSFSEALEQTEKARRDAAMWQAYFNWDEFETSSSADAATPLCAAQFEHEMAPTIPSAGGVSFTLTQLSACVEPFKFKLRCVEGDSKPLRLEMHWDRDVLSNAAADILLEELRAVIESAVRDPSQPIGNLSLLSRTQWEQRLARWNDTREESIRGRRIHELFEAQVERTPEAVAVLYEDERITYDELNRRANQTAHYLCRLGVGPDALVGLMMERSIEVIIAMLGVLKAGGAYLPLDPAYPSERISFMLEDAAVNVLLTQESLMDSLPPHDAQVARMDIDREILDSQSVENPPHAAAAANLAYVIYTSGSTGRPKGVMISHGAICNRLLWMVNAFPLTADDRVLQKTPISFDASVWEIFAPIFAGAQLVMAQPGGHQDGSYLRRTVNERQITTIQLVPSMLQVFLDGSDLKDCDSLKRVFCGGETLPFNLQERFFANLDASLHNLYGPTEVSIDASCWSCQRDGNRQFVPIGHALANTQIYILDAEFNPVPIGAPGELYVGGDGLARGYHNRRDLTAERFIPNPFDSEPGRRLYRTGDLARHLSDGALEYLGRVDHQVKIRGFRIELGEIEAVLARHSAVRQVVVTADADVSGERRLTAYLVAAEGAGKRPPGELRTHLRQHLPDYMMPSFMVWLDELPLTPNGKIDRRALPEPGEVRSELTDQYVPARTPLEGLLVGIWREVLGLEQVGIEDNFFEVGGHSLLAAQVISRVRAASGVEIGLRSLFEWPRVSALAAEVERKLRKSEEGGAHVSGVAGPKRVTVEGEEVELSFEQQRLWFLDQLEPESTAYNIPSAARLRGELDVEALERAINEIVRRHEILRTVFIDVGGEPRQVVKPAEWMRLEMEDLREWEEEEKEKEVRERAIEYGERRFDLSRGPLLRVKLLRLGEEEHVLLMVIHHIVSDGWSVGVRDREMSALYEAYRSGGASPLEELEIQYADYAVWQRERMRGEELERRMRYWLEQMRGAPAILELPTDRPRPAVQRFHGAYYYHQLSPELTKSVRELSRKEDSTLFMLTLAAFYILLRRYTGSEDIVVGSDIANRNHVELEKLIGFFANQIALRADLSGGLTFRELLGRVRRVVLGAYAHQDLPFEKLVSALLPQQRDMSRNPIFQVMFVMQNAPMTPLRLADITTSPIKIDHRMAKFDIALFMVEREEGLTTIWNYNTDLFDEGMVGRMDRHYETLLCSITADPDANIDELQMFTEAERLQHSEEKRKRKESRRKKLISRLSQDR